jgi:hypothetical protein
MYPREKIESLIEAMVTGSLAHLLVAL